MKKKKIVKASTLLLVVALITAWGVNGIYAKYLSSGDGEGSAKVAKWGVTITADEGATFSSVYAKDDENAEVGANSVSSGDESAVIAPGTKGEFQGLKVEGKPDVAVKISNAGTVTLTGWSVGGSYYCPLKVNVAGTDIYGLDYESAEDFKAAIENKIKESVTYAAPGVDLKNKAALVPTVKWSWDFEGSDGSKVTRTDDKDTALGNLAQAPTIKLKLTTTVTQVD